MTTLVSRAALLAALVLAAIEPAGLAAAGERLPVVLVSSSGAFDRACPNDYRQGNDAEVMAGIAREFCTCIAGNVGAQGLGSEVLDFLGRTYSEDLTAFIGEHPNGEAWMEAYFAAEQQCKNADYGANEPPPADDPNPPPGPIEAASWGGIVRSGPGQEFSRVGTLEQGEHVMLLENNGRYLPELPVRGADDH